MLAADNIPNPGIQVKIGYPKTRSAMPPVKMNHQATLTQLKSSLAALGQQAVSISRFCQLWRSQPDLLAALPPRYAQVLEDLLARLEAGSLFTEESCSFSQNDLTAQLDTWLDKATQQLARP